MPPYDDPNKRVYRPDFGPDQQLGWTQFPEEEQINMAPAASSLKQQFMRKPPMDVGTGNTPMPTVNDLPEMGGSMAPNAGGEPLKKSGLKSL